MKINKKITATIVSTAICLSSFGQIAFASAIDSEIPEKMTPYAIIEYSDENTYQIIGYNEAFYEPTPAAENPAKELNIYVDLELLAQENAMIAEFKEKTKDLPVYKLENPKPAAGMIVEYDGEGYIKDIRGDSYQTRALPEGTRAENGVHEYGSHNNKITISDGQVLGEGRITNFVDKIGDNDNTLKRGDVATKGSIDNPWSGTEIGVRNLDNDVRADMIKNDNGKLGDAVLDVWKYGMEDLGVTWTSSVSINNGRYFYYY